MLPDSQPYRLSCSRLFTGQQKFAARAERKQFPAAGLFVCTATGFPESQCIMEQSRWMQVEVSSLTLQQQAPPSAPGCLKGRGPRSSSCGAFLRLKNWCCMVSWTQLHKLGAVTCSSGCHTARHLLRTPVLVVLMALQCPLLQLTVELGQGACWPGVPMTPIP